MSTIAIIAEYNPFHNGHAYQLEKARKICRADNAVVVLGGNFLQRGEAAMWDKYARARVACENGIDIVLELPFVYATGSAGDFAYGAVSLLNRLNSIDYLCFGAETDDEELLKKIAQTIVSEPDDYKACLKDSLSAGYSFPVSRQRALTKLFGIDEGVLASPNNILAIEYICALLRTNSSIQPVIIKRTVAGYHELNIDTDIASASGIRKAITENRLSKIRNVVSDCTFDFINESYNVSSPVFTEDLTPFLQAALINDNYNSDICDFNDDLYNRIKKHDKVCSYSELTGFLTTKNMTASRISRSLIHMLLGYSGSDRCSFFENGVVFYANVLAFRGESSKHLKNLSSNTDIPLIVKKADFNNLFSGHDINFGVAERMWKLDMAATNLYNSLVYNRYGIKKRNDYTTTVSIV